MIRRLNPDPVKGVIRAIHQGPHFKHLSMFVKDMGIGYGVVEIEIGNEHPNPFGGVHGGVYASVIDTADSELEVKDVFPGCEENYFRAAKTDTPCGL